MVDSNGQPLITLPKITYYKHEVELEGEPLQLYREIEAEISSSVKQAMKSDVAKPSVTRIRKFSIAQEAQFVVVVVVVVSLTTIRYRTVCLLLRLRQIACDPSLCPPDFIAEYVYLFCAVGSRGCGC